MTALLVIAKAPVAGRAKTRLSPPCTPEQAAALARAALEDTLAAVSGARGADRRVLVLDGEPGPWLPAGFEVIPQRAGGLAERLAGAFSDVREPALLVGMDTPQVTSALLDSCLDVFARGDAAFGPTMDGGYWGIGLRRADPAVFAGVPMSVPTTGVVQMARLRALGLRTASLPLLRDVDTMADAYAVATEAPDGRFAGALAELRLRAPAPALPGSPP